MCRGRGQLADAAPETRLDLWRAGYQAGRADMACQLRGEYQAAMLEELIGLLAELLLAEHGNGGFVSKHRRAA